METMLKGIYKHGRIDLQTKPELRDGSKVIIIPVGKNETQIDLIHLLMQQEVLEKIWVNKEEDLYGEI